MSSPQRHQINTTSIESPYGYRSINLYQGDICTSRDDVLIVSSHANAALTPSGGVIRALQQRYSLEFTKMTPLIVLRGVFGTHCLPDHGQAPYKRILVVRIPGARTISAQALNPLDVYRDAIWSVFGSLAALELRGEMFSTMSLPLLGGQRGYPIQDAMATTLRGATQWLKTSRSMHTINFYLHDKKHMEDWTNSMNSVLGRRLVDTARDQVTRALSDEILAKIRGSYNCKAAGFQEVVLPIENSLGVDTVCLQQVAAFGRVLTERIVQALCLQLELQWKGHLVKDIDALRNSGEVAPWMIHHFHSLRIFGNETVHAKGEVKYKPDSLKEEDLLPILISLLRVISFWDEWK